MKKILVPVDGSKNSERSLRYACWLAEKLAVSITILHVATIPRMPARVEPLAGEDLWERLEVFGQTILDEAKKIAVKDGCTEIDQELRRGRGNPGHEIVQFSRDIPQASQVNHYIIPNVCPNSVDYHHYQGQARTGSPIRKADTNQICNYMVDPL